jgi:hypothetical protein
MSITRTDFGGFPFVGDFRDGAFRPGVDRLPAARLRGGRAAFGAFERLRGMEPSISRRVRDGRRFDQA